MAFVWGIHRGPVNSPHKWPVTRKMFPSDDVILLVQLLGAFTLSVNDVSTKSTATKTTRRQNKSEALCFIPGIYSTPQQNNSIPGALFTNID